jgi:hypothetical protein
MRAHDLPGKREIVSKQLGIVYFLRSSAGALLRPERKGKRSQSRSASGGRVGERRGRPQHLVRRDR